MQNLNLQKIKDAYINRIYIKMQSVIPKKYTCSKCKIGYGHRGHLESHFKRKKSCVEGDESIPTCITTLFTACQFCSEQVKTETTVNFMKKHLETCPNKSTITSITNNYITNNNNIQLNSYQQPYLSHLKYSKELLLDRIELLRLAYYNTEVPQNHTIVDVPGTTMTRFYNSNNEYTEIPIDKLPNKISYILDKIQEFLINRSNVIGKEKELLEKELDNVYGEIEKMNMKVYPQIIRDFSIISRETRKIIDQQTLEEAD